MRDEAIQELSAEEISALASAGTWYAKYHARIIAEKADDQSARALSQRERYEALLSALKKLGIPLPSIDLLQQDLAEAEPPQRRAA